MKKHICLLFILKFSVLASAQGLFKSTDLNQLPAYCLNERTGEPLNLQPLFSASSDYASLLKELVKLEDSIQIMETPCHATPPNERACEELSKLGSAHAHAFSNTTRFHRTVFHTAEGYLRNDETSARIQRTSEYFFGGQPGNAAAMFDSTEMAKEAEVLIKSALPNQKARQQLAMEYALKASLSLLDFNDSYRKQRAESCYCEALSLDSLSPSVLASYAFYLEESSRLDEAIICHKKCLDVLESPVQKAITMSQIGKCYGYQLMPQNAEEWHTGALNIWQSLPPATMDTFAFQHSKTLFFLGSAKRSQGLLEETKPLLEQALAIRKELAAKKPELFNTHLAECEISLAILYKDIQKSEFHLNHVEEALSLLTAAQQRLDASSSHCPHHEDHRYRVKTWRNYFWSITLGRIQSEVLSDNIRAVSKIEKLGDRVEPQKKVVTGRRQYFDANPEAQIYRERLADDLGKLAWYQLFAKSPLHAESSAREGLKIDPTQDWINTNLAHSLLFQGKWEEAKQIYGHFKGKPFGKDSNWTTEFLRDFEDLAKAGITHQDVSKMVAMLKE